MKKFLKVLFVLLLLAIIGVVVFIMTFDLDRYRQPIVNQISTALNRPVTIDKLSLKVSLIPTVTVSGIVIGNPTGMDEKNPFAKIDSLDVTLSLVPLTRKEIQIDGINIGAAEVSLVEKDGKNNWSFSSDTPTKSAEKAGSMKNASSNDILSQLQVNNISLKRLALNYQKEKEVQKVVVSDFLLKQLKVFSMQIRYDKQNVKISGTANSLLDLINKKKDYLFNLELQAVNATAKISGSIGDVSTFDNLLFGVDIYTNDLRKTLLLAGFSEKKVPDSALTLKSVIKGNLNELSVDKFDIALANDLDVSFKGKLKNLSANPLASFNGTLDLRSQGLAEMYGFKPMNIQLSLLGNKEQIVIQQAILTANKSDVTAKVTLSLVDKIPSLKGEMQSNYFDVADIVADASNTQSGAESITASGENKAAGLFSDKKLDLSALNSVNAQLGLNFTHLKVTDDASNYYGLTAQVQLLNGLLNVNPLNIKMLDGSVNGNIQINAQSNVPLIKAQLVGSNLVLDKLKGVSETLKGSVANTVVNLTATGDSPKALVSALTGNVELELTEGKIVNKWFNSLPDTVGLFSKNKSFSYSKTDEESRLNCAAMNLNVKNGIILMNKNIAVETSTINIVVSGEINLPKETLSVSMIPSISQLSEKANNKLVLTQLIKIEGPFTHPTTKLDAQAAVESLAQKGIEKGLNKLSKKLLGDAPSDDQSTSNVEVVMPAAGSLCQSALGHKLKGKITEAPVVVQPTANNIPAQVNTIQSSEGVSPKDQIKNQLMRSLTDVLKK